MSNENKQFKDNFEPKSGDTILLCRHVAANRHFTGVMHWHGIKSGPSIHFIRPDGSTGSARFLLVCTDCHMVMPNFQAGGEAIYHPGMVLPFPAN